MASTFLLLLIAAVIGTYFLTIHFVEANATTANHEENGHHNGYHHNGNSPASSSSSGAAAAYSKDNDKLLKSALLNIDASLPVNNKKPKKNVNYRLPTHMKPTHYRIQLTPFITEGNFTTDGDVSIKLTCLKNSYNITLNVNDILIDERSVNLCQFDYKQTECNNIEIRDHLYDKDTQQYIVITKEKLITTRNYTLNIRFRSNLNDLLQGFYRSSYIDPETEEKRWMASTQFSPTDARRAFPCFDEPSFKSTFKISIARDSTRHTSLSNMPLRKTQQIPSQENWVWDHYEETPVMSTYLVGFVVSDLKAATKITPDAPNQKVNISYWSRESVTNSTMYAQIITPQLLSFFETYFGIPFPLPKQDLVAIPDFGFSAMENWGLITFRESVLLFNETVSTARSLQSTATTIAHELGHQWFGNLVTPARWEDLWLKEGFADFSAYLGVHQIEKTWQMADQFVLEVTFKAFGLDQTKSSHPISVPVNNPTDIRQIFDPISYSKGAAIIRMMSQFLGESAFRNGLKYYLHEYSYSNGKQDDLWRALHDHSEENTLPKGVTVKTIMDSWTLKAGFPIITVKRDYENDTAIITQKRFLITESPQTDNEEKTLWYIPVTYTTQTKPEFNDTRTRLWMTKKEEMIENLPKDGWVVLNIQTVGFYRVNYDQANWEMLTQRFVNFPEITRVQFIDDSMSIARANQLNYSIALDMLKQIPKTQFSYLGWKTVIDQLNYLYNMLAFSPSFGNFQTFIHTIVQGTYSRFDFDEKPEDPHIIKLHRAQILSLACQMGYEHCTNRAQYLFREWMIDPRTTVKPNLKYVVYCTSVREGGEREWNFLFDHYMKSDSASDKVVILQSLGCSSTHWLLARYLNMTISENSPIRKQDGATVFEAIANNIYGAELALNFLRNQWDQVNAYYGEAFNTVTKMVKSAHTFLNTPAQLEEVLHFKRKHENNLYTSEMALNYVIDQVLANIEWKKNSYQDVADWLIEFNEIWGRYV
ncbi:aminopeptidase N-like isoform X2 [Chrysoperla carnea]|nr:aminopeptidase N-like isoform X2 [Chrysoperla carnea]